MIRISSKAEDPVDTASDFRRAISNIRIGDAVGTVALFIIVFAVASLSVLQ